MSSFSALPEPNFIDRDPEQVLADTISTFEEFSGRPLQPAQLESPLLATSAYREALVRIAIQEAGKQTLVRYARFPMLDYLGEFKGVLRLEPQYALTTLRFTLVAAQAFGVLIPAGTRVESKDGKLVFETMEAATIAAGATTADVTAQAQSAGILGNGYLQGEVSTLMDPITHVAGAVNLTATSGGADEEDDDHYRERIILGPEGYSTAGPKEAYQFHALKASSTIIDVAVESPEPGTIVVYPLTTTGNPSSEVLDLVEAYLNSDKIRPLSDLLLVESPTEVPSVWVGQLTVQEQSDAPSVKAEAETQLAAYAALLKTKLAQHEVPERIEAIVNAIGGVYRFVLEDVDHRELAADEWLNVTSITVNLVGTNNG